MNKKGTRALASATVVGLVLSTVATGNVKAAPGDVTRIGGADLYETASNVAKANWKDGAENVVLVSGEGYADSLSASVLATKLNAPIILTSSKNLDKNAKDALTSLKPKNVYVVGGNYVISKEVRNEVKGLGLNIAKELYGNTQFDTNLAIANYLVDDLKVDPSEVLVVNGKDGYADALSVAPVAASKGQVLLIVSKNPADAEGAAKFVKAHNSKVTVVGTKNIVPTAVLEKLGAKEENRVNGGLTQFDTNLNVMKHFGLKYDKVYVADASDTKKGYADALVASAIAGRTGSALILTDRGNSKYTQNAINHIKENKNDKTEVEALGGNAVMPEEVVNGIKDAVKADSAELAAAKKAVKAYEDAKVTNLEEINAAKALGVEANKAVEAVKDQAQREALEAKIAAKDKLVAEAEAKLGVKVKSVNAITKTEVTVVLAEKPEIELSAGNFVVKANGTDVKVEKLTKVDSDLTGKTYKLTVVPLDKNEGKLTVNGVEKDFDFKAPEVKGIEVKDATHIVVNFNEELNEDSIVESRFNVKKVTGAPEKAEKVVLNADKKSVTVTVKTALVPADYVLALGDAANPKDTVQDAAKNGIYAGTEVSFRPTAAQIENKVAPALTKATYNKGTGLLSLTFDKSILDSKLDVTKLSINGVVLTAADVVDTKTADDNYVEIKLGEVSKKAVNALEGELKLTAAKDAYGIADKLTDGETFAIAKEEPAVVKSAAYNQETNILTVTFDQAVAIVEASQANGQILLNLNVEGGAVKAVKADNVVGDKTLTQVTWKFDLGVADNNVAADVEGLANVATKLKVFGAKDIFVNAAKVKNTDAQKDYENGVAVAYTKDEKKPSITGVEFNNLTNKLTLKFSEKVTLGAGNFIIDTEETDSDATRATIEHNKFTDPTVAKDTFVASLQGPADDAIITALNNLYATGKDLKLTVAKEIITDTNSLQNDAVDFAHGINVVFHDYVKPSVTGITTESSTKVKVVFNEKVDKVAAETVANYVIKDATGAALAVTGAQLQADGKTVYLTTATQTSGKPYDVTVSNVKDLQGNIMDTKLQKGILGNGEVKDAKLEVKTLEAKAVQNGKDTLKVTFSAQVDPLLAKNLANYAVLAKGTDVKYEDAKAVSLAGATAKIDPADPNSVIITLADGVNILNTKEYKVIVSNVKDVYGNGLDATKVSTTVDADGDNALVAPKVTINQLDGKDNDTVTLVFNEQLNPETVVKGNFTVDGKAVTGVSTSWDAKKEEYTVTLQTGADFTEAKDVVINKEVVDLAGNAITAGANTTIAANNITLKDAVKPTVSTVKAKAISEAKDTIEVTFDKDVVEASAKVLANYTLTDENGKAIDLKDAEIAYANKVATITLPDGSDVNKPAINLQHGKNYTVTVANVVDVKGNDMDKVTKTVTWAEDSDKIAPTYTVATEADKATVTLTFDEKVDLSKVDLSTFTIKYDEDKADANNELTKLNPIYVAKADDSKTITITLDNKVPSAAAGKTAIVIASINEGKEVYDLAGNKAAHDAVFGNDLVTEAPKSTVTAVTVVTGQEAVVTNVDASTHKISVANATTVNALKAAIQVEKGSFKVYTDNTKATEATGTDEVTGTMVVEATAQDGTTKQVYTIEVA